MELDAATWISIAAICASVLVAIKWWDPIAVYLGYSFSVHRHVEDLGRKVEMLGVMQIELRYHDPFPSSAERIRWLQSVDDLQNKEEEIKVRLDKYSLYYSKRCDIGREAHRELNKANDLISQGDKLLPEVKASPRPVRHVQTQELRAPLPGMEGSYKKVLDFIKDNSLQSVLLGIWGMGGVGKTTLINLVCDSRSKYHDDFTEVLFVQAGKGCSTVVDLQKAISISIALPQIGNQISQANIIHNHLKDKSFLLLLDDLWEDLDLDEVGIPSLKPWDHVVQPHRRKLVFTTRSMYVCSKMGCHQPEDTIQMECLRKEDACNLFARQVGSKIFDDEKIHELAKEIIEECSGLPMALCTLGKFMSPKKDHREWRTARDLLRNSKLHEITNTHEDLFKRLQESYNILTAVMKKRFLLCSLWPENKNIPMKILIRWWIGLGLLDGFSNASDVGYTLINDLVRASMLEKGDTSLDSTENSHVKMHTMTRLMAIWIVNEHGYKTKWLPNSSYRAALGEEKWQTVEKAWVSEEDTSRWCQWSSKVCFPELKVLVAQHVFSLKLIHYFKNITFLDLEGTKIKGLPFEICSLTELQHLNLSATAIVLLPLLLRTLSKLKYLYIRNNMVLQTIPEGLILGLKSLRGLDLFHTGASFLNVLQELARSTLDLDMLGYTVQTIAEITQLGQLKRVCTQALCMDHFEDERHPDIINLQILSELQELRELAIVESYHSQKVLVAEGGPNYDQWLLPYLEIFELKGLLRLEKVMWKNAGMDIRVVSIYKCDKLKDVTWVHHLKLLEQLTVTDCKEMQRLIEISISFPRLEKLKLEDLPRLTMISGEVCQFQKLAYICVTRCNHFRVIHNQKYEQGMIKIDCNKDWWNRITSGRLIPYLVPTFCS
ncbi:hypothetical protein ACQJBY_025659 [Aegilops geniculata]